MISCQTKLSLTKRLICLLSVIAASSFVSAQEVPFSARLLDNGDTYINIKGDYTFLSNSVMNRIYSDGTGVNVPYNGNSSNNSLHIEYVDIDSDPTTYSSSSSTLTLPTCSQIYWAGLYWAGNYDYERWDQNWWNYNYSFPVDYNHYDVTQIKFQVPGGTYVDLQADNNADPVGEEDEIIIDGFNTTPNDPYVCFKNVTGMLQALADPSGEYMVANVRGTRGATSHGAAGWTLVVIYENPSLPGKYISVFDGYEGITTQSGNNTADINISGFNTIPVGPVNARIGVSSLEGETSLSGDTFGIISNSSSTFTDISDAANPNNNFFNSTISEDGVNVTTRNINSTNAIGFDSDVFDLNNPGNSIIDNGDTSATLRLGTSGDWFASFLVTFAVEIIEPTIVLEKKVEDIGGNDITGLGVNLGQYLDYVLSFVNTGNDDATNYIIRDVLPINVTLDELNITMPAGVTYTYDSTTREIIFSIPDNLVEIGDPISEIRMRVQVAENCFDFVDACTDQIENLAYSTYEGVINDNQISDDPSVSDFDACGFTTPGATNFLLDDLENCDYTRTVQLCGEDVLLDAGDNFDAYIWYIDENDDRQIDAGDTVITDGDPDSDPSTLLVTEPGTYIVDKQVADPCKGFQEIILVELFGATQSNPITALINDTSNTVEGTILTCPNDGEELPEIFLCGLNDTELIQINIPDADSIDWERLDDTSCAAATPDCANKDNSCTWNNVGTGNNFTASDAGEYRLQINYQNGCFSRFYFNVYKNPLDPQYTSTDIICNSLGNITVTNMPVDYEFQLVDASSGTVLVPYNANPSFDISTNGAYRVEMRQQGVSGGCVFVLDNIGILQRNFQVDVVPRDTDCTGLGEISISVLDVEPQYYYEISQGGTTMDTFGPSNDNNYTFANLNDGVYDILVTTDDGCNYTEQVTINDFSDLDLQANISQHITCREGNIQMNSSGGQTPHTYAIWSFIDEFGATQISYPTVGDIPASEYQTSVIFDILDPGDYTFVVVDRNNCHAISNTVTILLQPSVEYTTSTTDIACFGIHDGVISINLTNSNGYQVEYFLIDSSGTEIDTNGSGTFIGLAPGDYQVRINQRKGSSICDYFEDFTLTGPADSVSGNAALLQDYTCLQNGSIEAQNVVGGTAPYEYSIDGVNFVNGVGAETFTNLTDGTYSITIRDANGCTVLTNSITIDPLVPPSDLTFSATAPNCPSNTSDVVVTVVDGEAPYVFEIISPSAIAATSITGNTANFDGLSPNTYTFRVTDDKGCTYDESFTINPVTPINVIGQLISNVTCFGDTDGEVSFTVGGFSGDYDYTVSGPTNFSGNNETNATLSFNTLSVGTYTITVTDNSTNCTDNTSVTVNGPAAALTVSATETQPTCLADGSVVLTSTGGWGSNTFTLINPDSSTFGTNATGIFNNLVQSGNYTAQVSDVNGCVVSTNFTINAAVAPVLQLTPNDFCYDSGVGLTLTASITSGGDGNFEYSLNGGAFDTNNIFSGLGPGTYTVDVRDGNDCTDTASITINPELTVVATAPNITACAASTDIDITAAGGDGNYVFAVVIDGASPTPGDFSTTNPITVSAIGDYDVYVRDNNGSASYCEATYDITISSDAPLLITPAISDVSCFNGTDGSISIAASGGQGPYEYSIDNGVNYQTGTDFLNLPAGGYTLAIRDNNGCTTTTSVNISQPLQLTAEALLTQDLTCLQTGEITIGSVTPTSGGSGTYQYSLNGTTWSGPTAGGTVFSGLSNGSYTVHVRDANATSCFITLPSITIDPLPTPPAISFSIVYNCDGSGNITVSPSDPSYQYSLNGGAFQSGNLFANVPVGNHVVTIDYGRDCTTQANVEVEDGNAFGSGIVAFENISCNGGSDGSITFEIENFDVVNGFEYSVNSGPFSAPQTTSPVLISGLTAGTYSIEVRDVLDTSCTITLNQTLVEPTPIITAASLTDDLTCTNGGGTISASATGGTPDYEFQLEDGVGGIIAGYDYATNGNNTLFTGLAAGDYIVRAQDTNGCEDPIDVVITIANPSTISFTTTATTCYSGSNDATIQVDVTSGNGDYQFSLNGGAWITPTPSSSTTHVFPNLSSGTYTIDVRDGFGCAGVQQNVTINPQLTANAVLTTDLTCLALASVTINAAGGSGTYTYEWSNNGGASYASTNFTGNVFTTNTFGDFVFRVTDTTAPTACQIVTNTITISEAQTPVISNIVPTHILCNGDSTGALDVTIDTSIGVPPYVIEVIETNTSTNYGTQTTGLPAGDYSVTITDDKGCVSNPFLVSITEPDPITYSINLQPITCDPIGGTNPGSITVENVMGGTAEYTYYLTGNNGYDAQYNSTAGGEDHTFSILEFGIYEVDVVDTNGCNIVTTNIIASPPNDLDIDVSTVTASCAAGGTAIVTVSSAVGSGDYQFAILETFTAPYSSTYVGPDVPLGDTATFTGLVPGITYTFVVFDNITNCYYFEEASAPINSPSAMTATLDDVANITCTGAADGNVSFSFDNYDVGATSVNYEIYNAQSNTTTGITGSATVNPPAGPVSISNLGPLPQGIYYVLLEEVGGAFNGCSISSIDFTITEASNLLQVTAASPTNDNCNVNAGVITATAQFGASPYEFQYLLSTDPAPTAADPGWTTATTINVESGDYIVYVKDANDCIQHDAVTVLLDADPEFDLAIVDECVAEGQFEVIMTLTNPASAMAPFTLSINGGPNQNITFDASNQYTVSGLSSGLGQTLTLTDLNGCTDIDPFNIQTPLQFTAALTTLLDCEVAPASNAEITIDVTAGSGNYDYEIDGPGAADQARTAMGGSTIIWTGASVAGAYTVTVYDTSTSVPNCLGSLVVDVPAALVPIFTESHLDVSCNGANDGTISLFQTDNGIVPLTYSISPVAGTFNAATNTFEDLPAGTYTITGTGTNSCTTAIAGIIINEPAAIALPVPSIVEFGCSAGNNSDNATITIDPLGISGGSGIYVVYEFIDTNGTPSTADDVIVQSGSNNVYVETDRTMGDYIVNVYDDNGCLGSTTATIVPLDELLMATAAITNPLSCSPGSDGEITITVTSTNNDTTRFEYSIDNGANYQTSNVFSGLSAGTHNFLVRHIDTGCIIGASETLADPNTFTIDVVVVNDVICFGTATGQVTFELLDGTYVGPIDWTIYDTNGTPANFADDIPVTSGSLASTGPTAAVALAGGDYYVEVSQSNFPQCTNIEAFTIASPSASITGAVNVSPITCLGNDGEIEIVNVLGGWGNYQYFVGTSAPTGPGDYVASPSFGSLGVGTYEAWVIDSAGCEELIQNAIVLSNPTAISASLQVNNENCTNIEGEIEVVAVSGGQGSNYTYQLIRNGSAIGSPQSSPVFSNLGEGSYEVLVADQWSCSFTTTAELLYDEMVPIATVIKDIDCSVSPDGEITINVTGGSGNFDYFLTFPDLVTTINNTTGVFTGLAQAGTYTIDISDLNTSSPVCTTSVNAELTDPTPVTFDLHSIVDVSCNGGADGSITVNLQPTSSGVNDDAPYVYNLYDATGTTLLAGPQSSPTFINLSAAFYQVEAVSSKSCSLRQTVEVQEPSALSASATATPFACTVNNLTNTSTISVTALGGVGNYLYSLDNVNFQTASTFEVADSGTVQNLTIFVNDGNGCATTAMVSVQPINAFSALVSQNVAISCANPEEVLVSVTDDGNPGNIYTFELLPAGNPSGSLVSNPTNTSAIFTISEVGTFTFRITDTTTGCYVETAPYTIAPYDLIDVVATSTAPAICFGDSNGSMEITISGYSGAYDYEVFTQAGASVLTGSTNTATNPYPITGLSGGNYYVQVTQTGNPLCVELSNTTTINSPDVALSAPPVEIANVSCTNDQGEIEVSPTGGYAPYSIVLTNTTSGQVYNANNVPSMVFTGLSEGSYTVQITDNGGCVLNESIVLTQPTPITAAIDATPTTLLCYGDTNAVVTAINVLGGEGVYQYQLNEYDATGTTIAFSSGWQSTPVFDNIGAGIYSITVSDGWNCGLETAQVTISEPLDVMASLVQASPLTCNNPAQLLLTATGGTGPYEYSADGTAWNAMSGGNSHNFAVNDGVYQYHVRDSFGCEAMISNEISVDAVPPLTITIDDGAAVINCAGESTATIVATTTGGLGNYSFELYSDAALSSLVSGPQSSDTFANLPSGNYFVRVTSGDCVEVSNEIIITDPAPLQIDRQEFTDVSCSGLDDGTITVEVSGGTGQIFYAITPNLNQFDTENVFTDLSPGVYDVIAQDTNGCFIPFQFTIVEPQPIAASAINIMHEVCQGSADGAFELNISGGTAPYRTSLNSNNDVDYVQGQLIFNNLASGTHVVFVKDAQDCETNVVVEINPGVNLNATVTPMYMCTGNIPENQLDVIFEDTTVLSDVLYAIDSTDPADMVLTSDFANLAPGPHYLTIAHANGCINTIDFEIDSFEPLTLVLEQNNINEITAVAEGGVEDYTFYFGDVDNGTDNTYYINRTDTYTVRVIDQNGCEAVAEIFMEFIDVEIPDFFTPDGDGNNDGWVPENLEGFPNALTIIFDRYGRELYRMKVNDAPWNGIYQNHELPSGDYWYVLKLNGENDDREFVGHFTLYR